MIASSRALSLPQLLLGPTFLNLFQRRFTSSVSLFSRTTSTMSRQAPKYVSTPLAPKAIGPYSQAVIAGDMVYTAGAIPLSSEGTLVGEGDVSAQTAQCLRNLSAVLSAAGSSMDRVVKATVFLTNLNDFSAMNVEYERAFGATTRPARSCVQVSRLPRDVLVEIECIAML